MTNSERPGQLLLRRHGSLTLVVLLVAMSLLAMLVPTRAYAWASDGDSRAPEYSTWDDLSGKTVGMVTGATFESVLREKCPNVGDVVYYSSTSDLIAALQASKIDAFINSTAVGTLAVNRYSDLALFPADELWDKWTAGDDGDKTVPEQDWEGANGTLNVAACQSLEPVSYLGDGQMLGYDIETLLICAEELDVHLKFEHMEFSDVLSYIQSGKSDLGCGSILITEERVEAMDFATTHENDLIVVVRSAEGADG